MPFMIIRQDITKMKVDAIVNAANTELQMGGGVCGAIFSAAGASELQAACNKLSPIKTGEAVITDGFRLPAKYIIHTAGPVYKNDNQDFEILLRLCYKNSLILALKNKCKSIAFPLISSGIYGCPKTKALEAATDAIKAFLEDHYLEVTLAVFDNDTFLVSSDLLGGVESYINEHYVESHLQKHRKRNLLHIEAEVLSRPLPFEETRIVEKCESKCAQKALDDIIGDLDESFSETLLRLIDCKGKTDAEVYKRANIDRKLFSKIRTGKGYMPSKKTAVALAIALTLSIDETDDLLQKAGFALSHSVMFDVIIEYFIRNGKYDVFEINEVLFHYDQPILGG